MYWDKEAKWICSSGRYELDVNGYSGIKRLNVLVMGEEARCTGYRKKETHKGLVMAKGTSYCGTERINGLIIVGPGDEIGWLRREEEICGA